MVPSPKQIRNILKKSDLTNFSPISCTVCGGFLDDSFINYLRYYFALSSFRLDVNKPVWSPLWRSLQQYESAPESDIVILSLSMKELFDISNLSDSNVIFDSLNRIQAWLNCVSPGSTYFLLFDQHLTGSALSSLSLHPSFKALRSLFACLYSFHDSTSIFCIESPIEVTHNDKHRVWIQYGFPYSFCEQDYLTRTIASTMISKLGFGKKLIVCDLDQTLWPHTIGELDDPLNCILDPGNPLHRYYYDLQRSILNLKQQGFLLAICSKNNPELYKSLFCSSGHLLSLNDFVAYSLSWNSKSDSIRSICNSLNILTSSVIFVDNSIAECTHVSSSLPEVLTICIGDDPSLFADILSECFYLNSLFVDGFASSRYSSYQQRSITQPSIHSNHSPSLSLDLSVSMSFASSSTLDRIIQLVNKTNQFNLNGTRLSYSEIRDSPYIFCFSMSDKYSDYGLTSVFIASVQSNILVSSQWVISCRTFARGYEYLILEKLSNWCISSSISNIHIPFSFTGKNKYMSDLFAKDTFIQQLNKLPVTISLESRTS